MAANPGLLLATNFGAPESAFAKFPKGAVITGRPSTLSCSSGTER
jgi:hypothetical protein